MKKTRYFLSLMLSLLCLPVFAQNFAVKGVICDSNGAPIPAAAVIVKGTANGTIADIDGVYSLSTSRNAVLVFSSVGFKAVEVEVDGRHEINITLEDDSKLLNEAIAIAYGTATRSAFTGSASVLKSDEIAKKVASNVTSALAGTTPGVQVLNSNGDPSSSAPTIRIRGIGSMSASSAPLVVVDGVPYDGNISDINPADVDNISVLKDAASTALYGHRGGNGVVLITTKKGKSGEAQVTFDAKFGSNSRLIPQYDVISDPGEYYETVFKQMYNKLIYSGNFTPEEAYAKACANIYDRNNGGVGYRVFDYPEGQELIGRNFKLNPNATLGWSDGTYYYTPDNWYDEVFHNSFRQEYNVNVSGSSDRFNYYASAGYLDDGGIVDNSSYKRYSARINAEYQAKSWAKIVSSLSYTYSESKRPYYTTTYGSSGNLFYITNTIGPIYPLFVRNADGTIVTEGGRKIYDSNNTNQQRPAIVGNAVRDNAYDSEVYAEDVLNGRFGAVLTPVKGLTLSATVGVLADNDRGTSLYSKFASGAAYDGQVGIEQNRLFVVNTEFMANYKKQVDKDTYEILAGFVQMERKMQLLSGSNSHLFAPGIGELSNALSKSDRDITSYTHAYMTQGFVTRLQYDHDEKYFLSASFNRNASSRFSAANRWGNFWSVGGGWLLNKEDFLADKSWINMLKLKASYGVNGNDNFGSSAYYYYSYADQYKASYNEDTNEYSLSLVYKGNESLKWEKNAALNIGLEFDLYDDGFNGTIDFFDRRTNDLLYSKDVPLSSGNPTGAIPVNVGSIQNVGFDATFDGSIISGRNFSWRWNANFSHYTNRILSLDTDLPEKGIIGSNYVYRIGGSLYEAYMYKYAGVNKDTGAAQYYKEVKDGDTVKDEVTEIFDEASKYDLGSVLPKLYGGLGTSINAFGLDFSIQLSYQLGGRYYDGNYQAMMCTQSQVGSNYHKDVLKSWTPENTNTDIPRLDGDYSVGQSAIDRFLISSDYLSLNNVTLGYTVPAKRLKNTGLSSMRFYLAGENLAVISARKGVDPRFNYGLGSYTSGSGLNTGAYSAMRTITGGITLTF